MKLVGKNETLLHVQTANNNISLLTDKSYKTYIFLLILYEINLITVNVISRFLCSVLKYAIYNLLSEIRYRSVNVIKNAWTQSDHIKQRLQYFIRDCYETNFKLYLYSLAHFFYSPVKKWRFIFDPFLEMLQMAFDWQLLSMFWQRILTVAWIQSYKLTYSFCNFTIERL